MIDVGRFALTGAAALTAAGLATALALAACESTTTSDAATPAATASGPPVPMIGSTPVPAATVVAAHDVLAGLDQGAPSPDAAVLAKALAPLLRVRALGSDTGMDVMDVATGRHLASVEAGTAQVAASTLKILTAAAALATLGPQTGLPTKVAAGATSEEIVLVGGGDVLLAAGAGAAAQVNGHAGLGDLAAQTAAALSARGITSVALGVDDSLFSGPTVSPSWSSTDVPRGFVAPVTALAVDTGRAGPGHYPRRHADPSLAAAAVFAAHLREGGITVKQGIARVKADSDAQVYATVTGAPVGDVVEYMLTTSDNTVAEVLARLVASATGRPATFADAGVAVLEQVAALGVAAERASMTGGSGLGRTDSASAAMLTEVLALAAGKDHPELRPVLSGLPVAAVTGTLATRFASGAGTSARGVVRAKTGSLSGVNSLAGVVVDADGRLLAFAVLADDSGPTSPARAALDKIAIALAGCGCR